MPAALQLRYLACNVHDLVTDAGNLGLPVPLGIELGRGYGGDKTAAQIAVKILVDPAGAALISRIVSWLRAALVDDCEKPGPLHRPMSCRRRRDGRGTPLKDLGSGPALTVTPQTSRHNTPQPTVDITSSRASKNSRHELVVGHPKHWPSRLSQTQCRGCQLK